MPAPNREPVLAILLGPEDEVLGEWWVPTFFDRFSLAQIDRAKLYTAATAGDVVNNTLLQVDYEYDAVESELQRMAHPHRHPSVCIYKQRR